MTRTRRLSINPDCSNDLSSTLCLHVPPLEQLADAIREGLQDKFEHVEVSVVPCPDLSAEPFGLTGKGIGGDLRIGEVGGPGNLFPEINKDKQFNLAKIAKTCELPEAFVFGPGAGPWQLVGVNCEMVADATFGVSESKVATKTAKIVETAPGYEMGVIDSPAFSLMGNLAVGDGQPGQPVVRVEAIGRKREVNYTEGIRQAVAARFGEEPVSLAGVWILKEGKANFHVMPDFPGCNWTDEAEIGKNWLKYFEVKAPLVCTTILHSADPGHGLRLEHSHGFSSHGDAGHYHYDTTPETAHYEGYFAPAHTVYRIDRV